MAIKGMVMCSGLCMALSFIWLLATRASNNHVVRNAVLLVEALVLPKVAAEEVGVGTNLPLS